MFLGILSLVTCYIPILVSIAFFTLFERKGLGYFQNRKGPNKVGYFGIIQPFADAMKLFCKEQIKLISFNIVPYFFAPVFSLMLALCLWSLYYSSYAVWFSLFGVLFFLSVSAINVYSTLMAGWASNSKYALLGAFRAIAQTISYEVSLALILLSCVCLSSSFNLCVVLEYSSVVWSCFLLFPVCFMWFVSILAETNRAPFDFAEGESELVSGFNIEYGSGGFALIFMAEYANILFMSMMSSLLFFGGKMIWLVTGVIAFCFVWVRASFPRFRYDLLMQLTWTCFLPMSLFILSFVLSLKFFLLLQMTSKLDSWLPMSMF
uniref:NADH-ubiquinone oxidoreductase chain 1 n=1 Tax=Nierstraszella lineata TaxID=515354 RepID=A0A6H1PGU4_9MOLL|nr:NADH dehydrogenase subunit 1 [Nierstraszella lineata]QIZ12577.1 NADH dehydrogenase subunit 1 [Nierstraszella lineata]